MRRLFALGAPLLFAMACGNQSDPDNATGSGQPDAGDMNNPGPDGGPGGGDDGGGMDVGPFVPGDINVEVGPEGGTVPTGVDFMALNVPPGALSEPTMIAVTLLDEAPVDGAEPVGPVVQFGPPGLEFAVPASLDFRLDDGLDPSQRLVLQQLEAGGSEPSTSPMFNSTAVIPGFTTFWPELRPRNEAVEIEILSVTPGTEAADSTPEQPRWEADGESVVVSGRVAGSTSSQVLVRVQRGNDFSYATSGLTDGEFEFNVGRPEDFAAGLWFATADGGSVVMALLCGTPCDGGITTLPNEAGEFFTSADPSLYSSEQLYLCDPSVVPVQLLGSDPDPVVMPFMTDDFTDVAIPPGRCDPVAGAKDIIFQVDSDARATVRVVPPTGFSARAWYGPSCEAVEASFFCSNAGEVEMDEGYLTTVVPEIDTYVILSPEMSGTDGVPYNVSFQVESLNACPGLRPQGQRPEVCDDMGNLVSCVGEGETQLRETCPHGCNQDRCNGDTCRGAIVINSFPFNFIGESSPAFLGDYETGPEIQESCGTTLTHGGEDAVFEVNLLQGEVLTVESGTTGLVNQRIFIKRTCDGAAECVGSSVPFNRISFEAPEAGTYFVFVDRDRVDDARFTALFDKE